MFGVCLCVWEVEESWDILQSSLSLLRLEEEIPKIEYLKKCSLTEFPTWFHNLFFCPSSECLAPPSKSIE